MGSTLKTIAILYVGLVIAYGICAALTVLVTPVAEQKVTEVVHSFTNSYHLSYDKHNIAPLVINEMHAIRNNSDPNSEFCDNGQKKKKKLTVFLLAFLVGGLGVDRFYTGYIAQGVFKILTANGLGIWGLVDWIRVLTGKRHEKNGCPFYDNM